MSYSKYVNSVLAILIAVGCVNCAAMLANPILSHKLDESSVLYSTLPQNQLTINKNLKFFSNEFDFSEPVKSVIWDHNLDGSEFCQQSELETIWAVQINCTKTGNLNLFLIVEYESGVDESFVVSFPILAQPNDTPVEPDMPDLPTEINGATLYSISCAGCHGDTSSSTKKGRSAGQIFNAIDNNTGGMGILSTMSQEEVDAIAEYLGTL